MGMEMGDSNKWNTYLWDNKDFSKAQEQKK